MYLKQHRDFIEYYLLHNFQLKIIVLERKKLGSENIT